MLINWVTVAAQIINFLILLYLLKRFLYGPIIRAMNKREERIRREMEEAETSRQEAERMQERIEAERSELQESKHAMLDRARDEVEQWKQESLERAREEVEENRRRWEKGLVAEQEKSAQAIRENLARQVVAVSDKVLRDLADGNLEQRTVDRFLSGISIRKEKEPEVFEVTGLVKVQLGMDSSEDLKDEVQKRIGQLFPKNESIEVEHKPGLEFGIRLLAGDRKWDWNLQSYMQNLEQEIFSGVQLRTVEEG